jgi:hypothetical protein
LTALKLAASLRSAALADSFALARMSVERMFPTKSYWYRWVPAAAVNEAGAGSAPVKSPRRAFNSRMRPSRVYCSSRLREEPYLPSAFATRFEARSKA